MTADELAILLAALVERGDISEEEARQILASFEAGRIAPADLPEAIAEATEETREDEAAAIAALLLLLLRRSRGQAGALRDEIRADAEAAINRAIADLPAGSSAWQQEIRRQLQLYSYSMSAAGLGQEPDEAMIAAVEDDLADLLQWLYLFAGAAAARRILGRPYSEAYLQNRARQYLARAWAAFHRAQESRPLYSENGWIVDYIARDDPATCDPCSEAAAAGPYLPGQGPYPGEICDGGGNCRCIRIPRWSPAEWTELAGLIY